MAEVVLAVRTLFVNASMECWCTGLGADPPADGEPPSEDVVAPAYPKYEGLAYKSAVSIPNEVADLSFPPASAAKPEVVPALPVDVV